MEVRLQQGIREFNDERFFEAHETWEDLWHEYREVDRTFLQGLIHLAAALYHCQSGNEKGTVSQLNKGIEKLQPYRPECRNVLLEPLLEEVQKIAEQAWNGTMDGVRYPKIRQTQSTNT